MGMLDTEVYERYNSLNPNSIPLLLCKDGEKKKSWLCEIEKAKVL